MSLKTSPLRYKKSPKSLIGSEPVNHQKDYSSVKNGMRAYSDKDDKNALKKKTLWPENTMKPKPKEKKEGQIIDFLKEQRIRKEGEIKEKGGSALYSVKNKDWKKDFDKMDLQGREKYEMFLGKAKEFEEKA